MPFARTVSTLFASASNLPIMRERQIAHLLISYEEQFEKEPDRALLEQAAVLLEQRLNVHPPDDELVRLAQYIYGGLGKYHAEMAVLRQFLATSPAKDSRAWAWWHLVDCLAMARCSEETVNEQQTFLAWALTVFPPEECFFVIADASQALSWLAAGVGDTWLKQFRTLFQQAPWTSENRLDRFYCLRTAVHIALRLHAEEEAQHALTLLRNLLQEDSSWQDGWWISVEASLLDIAFAQSRTDIPHMRTQAEQVTRHLERWEQEHLRGNDGTSGQIQRFRSLAHNTAALLYLARQYDLAMPLFQRAIAYHTIPHHAYLWLAASVWQTTHDRERVFPLLRQAAARYNQTSDPWAEFQQLPEFQDVREDADFRLTCRSARTSDTR